MPFTVITDTSANLPSEILTARNVPVIPFSYYINGEEHTCLDTAVFDGKGYYDQMREGAKVTTSQINPQRYADFFTPYLERGEDILFIGMSSGISGSFRSAQLAAEELRERFPQRQLRLIDTLGASLGEGIPVLKALDLRDAGVPLPEAEAQINALCRQMCQIFMVDDLMHLRKSGRISGAVAVVGTVLQIKPLLKGNEEGKIVSFSKVRGRKRAIETLAERYDNFVRDPQDQIVGIAHADCEEEARRLEELLRRSHPPKEILTVCYEPVTGAHVGPGTIALFFRSDDDVRSK